VDVIHVSSGGFDGYGLKPHPLYQVPLVDGKNQGRAAGAENGHLR